MGKSINPPFSIRRQKRNLMIKNNGYICINPDINAQSTYINITTSPVCLGVLGGGFVIYGRCASYDSAYGR